MTVSTELYIGATLNFSLASL